MLKVAAKYFAMFRRYASAASSFALCSCFGAALPDAGLRTIDGVGDKVGEDAGEGEGEENGRLGMMDDAKQEWLVIVVRGLYGSSSLMMIPSLVRG